MKKTVLALLSAILMALLASTTGPKRTIVEAQTLPYPLTVAWDASPDAVTYTCYLDGVAVVNGVTGLTCSFPVSTTGPHTVGVTAVNPAFVPHESAAATLAFTLKAPTAPKNVKVG